MSLGSIFSLLFLSIAFQTTSTREAEAQTQTTLTEILVDGSPWKGSWSTKKKNKKARLAFLFNEDGKLVASLKRGPAAKFQITGKNITLKGKSRGGKYFEFSLALKDNKLSGYVSYRIINVVV